MIRPEVQTLINRGNVGLDEVGILRPVCNLEEASALVPVLVPAALGLRLDRILAMHPPSKWTPSDSFENGLNFTIPSGCLSVWYTLNTLANESARRIQGQTPSDYRDYTNLRLAECIHNIVSELGGRPSVSTNYWQALLLISDEIAVRLAKPENPCP